ncbi:dephospho-CoA kinase [Virgibacillus halophilus]|uniref:dephospho-CoA kinase n=1 Tax=Tigheibacillus halophilus TaxID=361280 RepID=UPI003624FDF6
MTVVIGLTGGIATGKSTVSNMFKDLGIPVIDADVLAREAVAYGEPAYAEIIATFGEAILKSDKTINRKALGEIIFTDPEKRERLNKIVHPAVRQKMVKQRDAYVAKGAAAVVLDIPLLFEGKLMSFVDQTLVVFVKESLQLERLISRDGSSEADALNRIQAQIPIEEKVKMADAVIDNNGSKASTKKQLFEILANWSILNTENHLK